MWSGADDVDQVREVVHDRLDGVVQVLLGQRGVRRCLPVETRRPRSAAALIRASGLSGWSARPPENRSA